MGPINTTYQNFNVPYKLNIKAIFDSLKIHDMDRIKIKSRDYCMIKNRKLKNGKKEIYKIC